MFIAGIDAGGTSARLELSDLDGRQLCRMQFGPLNITGMSSDAYAERLREIFHACGDMSECASLCFGGAGVTKKETGEIVRAELCKAGFAGKLLLCGDHETALRGAIEGPGAILIAGTGSIAFGVNEKGTKLRVGGYGHLIDDPGSGYAIGRDALSLTIQTLDGRAEPNELSDAVLGFIGTSTAEGIVNYVYASDTGKAAAASIAPTVIRMAEKGDAEGKKILGKNAEDLACMAKVLINRLGLSHPRIALAGGLLSGDNIYRNLVCERISNFAEVLSPRQDPLAGATALAYDALRNKDCQNSLI